MERRGLADLWIARFPLGDSERGFCMETFSFVVGLIGQEIRSQGLKIPRKEMQLREFWSFYIVTLDCYARNWGSCICNLMVGLTDDCIAK